MKKIVGILGMAAVMAPGAFAAEPAANFVMTEFNGSADFGVKADFKDDLSFGMYNTPDLTLTFGFITDGSKATTGDGIWGELEIKSGDAVDYAPGVAVPGVSIETAKIHLASGNFSAALNIKGPSLTYDGFGPAMAVPFADMTGAGVGAALKDQAGFVIETELADVFAFNFSLADNGVKVTKDKKYALAFDASLLMIDDLTAKAYASFNFDNKYMGFGAQSAYKLALNNALYVTPGAAFVFDKTGDAEANMSLSAGAIFGWGATGLKPELDFIYNSADNFNEGVSVAVLTNLKDNGLKLAVGLYDESLFKLLGLEDYGTLKTGVEFVYSQSADETLKAAAKYSADIDVISVALHGGMAMTLADTTTTEYALGANVTAHVIDNTDLYVDYQLANNGSAFSTNEVKVGSKIHF